MMKAYKDCRERCVCYADAETGLIKHEYRHEKTSTHIPIGGTYRIERDSIVTILTRVNRQEFRKESYRIA
jgi:hypothetical protein